MRISMQVECDGCGSAAVFSLKRVTNALLDTGEAYEDYLSVEDGLEDVEDFSYRPDSEGFYLTCQKCNKEVEVNC